MDVRKSNRGGSVIGLLITLALIGYGVYVGLQYVPQYIESATVDTVLQGLLDKHRKEPLTDIRTVQGVLDKQLYINDMGDRKHYFSIVPMNGNYIVTARYERDLNLLFTTKRLAHEKSVTLD